MLEGIKKLLREEKAQGAIEYILLAGGILIAAVVVFAIYRRMSTTTATQANQTAQYAANCSGYTTQTACNNNAYCTWDSTASVCVPKYG